LRSGAAFEVDPQGRGTSFLHLCKVQRTSVRINDAAREVAVELDVQHLIGDFGSTDLAVFLSLGDALAIGVAASAELARLAEKAASSRPPDLGGHELLGECGVMGPDVDDEPEPAGYAGADIEAGLGLPPSGPGDPLPLPDGFFAGIPKAGSDIEAELARRRAAAGPGDPLPLPGGAFADLPDAS
jgi:hypothetical protein